jgi:hypothetical protein
MAPRPWPVMASYTLPRIIFLFACFALSGADSGQGFSFRNISYADLDAVTTTVVSAFDPGPMWTYVYQFRDIFPNYHWRCIREGLEEAYRDMDVTEYLMVIVPSEEGYHSVESFAGWILMTNGSAQSTGGRGTTPFLWLGMGVPMDYFTRKYMEMQIGLSPHGAKVEAQVPVEGAQQRGETDGPALPCSLHLDLNLVRAAHLLPQIQAAEKKYIEDAYEHQLYLGVLATHPDWDGHGFGAAQVEWGMEKAKAEEKLLPQIEGRKVKVPVTLMSTPAGYPLYKSLGFESVANVTIALLDNFDGGTTWFEYMRWFSD